jgi:7,8-dihydro-6-hydroxymethylpterin-pyrophosphokinase
MFRVTVFEAQVLEYLTLQPAPLAEVERALNIRRGGPTQNVLSWLFNQDALTKDHNMAYVMQPNVTWEVVADEVARKERHAQRMSFIKTVPREMDSDELFYVRNHLQVGIPRSRIAKQFGMERRTFDRWTWESGIRT